MSSINTLINGKIISIGAYMITLQDIQEKLAEAIKQSGMTQTNIGQLLNIRQQTVSHYVKGDIMPAFANLCMILDLDPSDILCINDYKVNNN